MAVQNKFERPSFPYRGKLSSADLNEMGVQISEDLTALSNAVNANEAESTDLAKRTADQMQGIQAELEAMQDRWDLRRKSFASRSLRLEAAISMHDLGHLQFPSASPANLRASVNPVFGQATVPINGIEQKFYTLDFRSEETVTPNLTISVTGTFDKLLGDGLTDYEHSGTITAGDTTLAFNGQTHQTWVRQVHFDADSDVDSVESELTVNIPNQINVQANSVTIFPFPWKDVDVTGLFINSTVGDSFIAVSSFTETTEAGNLRFFFADQQVAQVKIRLRQKNWKNTGGKKVFRYGLQELGLQLIDWDKTWQAGEPVTANHTLVSKIVCPEGYLLDQLDGIFTTPDFTAEDAGLRHLHFKIALDEDGSTVLWDSDQHALPQVQTAGVSLGRTQNTMYVLTTMNWVAISGGLGSPFTIGASPFLESIGITYTVVPE